MYLEFMPNRSAVDIYQQALQPAATVKGPHVVLTETQQQEMRLLEAACIDTPGTTFFKGS